MKGFVEYLTQMNAHLERELERDLKNIEVPYMGALYSDWLVKKDGKTENVAKAYMSYLRSVDNELFLGEEDFFELLRECLDNRDYDRLDNLFDRYAAIIDEWLEDSKKEDVGIPTKKIRDWRSGFRSYRKFIMGSSIPEGDSKKTIVSGQLDVNPHDRSVFMSEQFLQWLVLNGFTEGSAKSYISRLKRVNAEIFCRNEWGKSIFRVILDLMHASDETKVMRLLYGFDNVLSKLITGKDTAYMDLNEMSNCRSALRSYIQFMQEEVLADFPDTDEDGSENDGSAVDVVKIQNSIPSPSPSYDYFDYDILKRNFWLRLVTQSRMGKNKEVFYPISLLRRLFREAGEYDWFNKWVYAHIEEIKVITEKGEIALSELDKSHTLALSRATKNVIARLQSGDMLRVMTETVSEENRPVLMKARSLADIHIDHTPLISRLLADKKMELPVMTELSDLIRKVADNNGISLETKNFPKINGLVMDAFFPEMKKMIPALKQELELIRRESVLKLMSAGYNLRKKS